MVTIKDGCCGAPISEYCDWKDKLELAYQRALQSVNKIGDNYGKIYYPDGTGFIRIPIPTNDQLEQIGDNAEDIAELKTADIQLKADIDAETTARKTKDSLIDSEISGIKQTDATQTAGIADNADRITVVSADLMSTQASVATNQSDIAELQGQMEATAKSLVSDIVMTDGTTAGSVQVSIEREDGALITSTNFKWGRDIGVRLEAGTQEGYLKTVIDLSDGTTLTSNEYKIVEVVESDVYVTAITLVPDQTAGTIGGNISYNNGTTQTINSVSVPTAPGVTQAIESLQARMTAVETENTAQDGEITSLKTRVQNIEDTPGVGQFGNSKLGTISGSTSDGKIGAEEDGTGSVNGWADLKQRVATAEGEIDTNTTAIDQANTRINAMNTAVIGNQTAINNLTTSKQNKLTAGEGIDITDDVISAQTSKTTTEITSSDQLGEAMDNAPVGAILTFRQIEATDSQYISDLKSGFLIKTKSANWIGNFFAYISEKDAWVPGGQFGFSKLAGTEDYFINVNFLNGTYYASISYFPFTSITNLYDVMIIQ